MQQRHQAEGAKPPRDTEKKAQPDRGAEDDGDVAPLLRDIPHHETVGLQVGDHLEKGDERDDVGEFPELGRTQIAGDPGADGQAEHDAQHPVEEQPAGVAQGFLQVVTPLQPFPEHPGQVSHPGLVHAARSVS